MILREYQTHFVKECTDALIWNDNSLAVAPTGSGKTIMLSAVIQNLYEELQPGFKACVLAHRKELTEQNLDKFQKINPHITTSLVNAEVKDWSGEVTFAMVQTLANKRTLASIPYLDLLVIDETHHVVAKSYEKIIKQARMVNPNVRLFGVTATPNRGDKCNLGNIFDNCAEQIFLLDLIEDGYLVEPKTFVVDVVQKELGELKVTKTGDYSESEVAAILDKTPILNEVVFVWKEKAGDRKTVVFCSTIEHARHVTAMFLNYSIPTAMITSDMSKDDREEVLRKMISGEIQVLINVMILTEGWDFPPISCVVLLRQSSHKSMMIQMIGRGLRTIDPELYPNIEKKDCIVLDFGISTRLHKSLEDEVNLEKQQLKKKKDEDYYKQECPKCEKLIPLRVRECMFCGYEFNKEKEEKVTYNYAIKAMKEINMLQRSEIAWTDLQLSDTTFFASGFNVWTCIFQKNGKWLVSGGDNRKDGDFKTKIFYEGDKYKDALKIAEKFLHCNEKSYGIVKDSDWRHTPATEKQLQLLKEEYRKKELSKGEASTLLAFQLKAKNELIQFGLVA